MCMVCGAVVVCVCACVCVGGCLMSVVFQVVSRSDRRLPRNQTERSIQLMNGPSFRTVRRAQGRARQYSGLALVTPPGRKSHLQESRLASEKNLPSRIQSSTEELHLKDEDEDLRDARPSSVPAHGSGVRSIIFVPR